MSELTGRDDLLIDRIIKTDKTLKAEQGLGFAMLLLKTSAIYSISSIDGNEIPRPTSLQDIYDRAGEYRKRDMDAIVQAYTSLNAPELAQGEADADEKNSEQTEPSSK